MARRKRWINGERNGNLHYHTAHPYHEVGSPEPHNPHPVDRTHKSGLTEEGRALHIAHIQDVEAEGDTQAQALKNTYENALCCKCHELLGPGTNIWWHPTLRIDGKKAVWHRGKGFPKCDDGQDPVDPNAEKPTKKRSDGKASKGDIDALVTLVTSALDATKEAETRSKAAEEKADDATNELLDAKDQLSKAREIVIVREEKKDGKIKHKKIKLGPVHAKYEELLYIVEAEDNVVMVGDAGGGKTHAPSQVARALGLEFLHIPVGPQTSNADLRGYMNGAGKYVTTMLRRGYTEGGVILLDEMDAANPSSLTIINGMLDAAQAGFQDGMAERHPDCHFIAAMNTYGRGADAFYVGRAQLDGATLSRWSGLEWNTDWNLTRQLVKDQAWVDYCEAIYNALTKTRVRHAVGMRTALKGQKQMSHKKINNEQATNSVIWFAINESDERQIRTNLDEPGKKAVAKWETWIEDPTRPKDNSLNKKAIEKNGEYDDDEEEDNYND